MAEFARGPADGERPAHDLRPVPARDDRAAGGAPDPRRAALLRLNLPNKLTLSRLVLAPVFALLLLARPHAAHVAALALYVLLALTDLYDGWLARRTGIVTSFGKFMDPLADKVLVSAALIVFLAMDLPFVPASLVLLIVAREFLVTGLRSLAGYRGVVIIPTLLAKMKTVSQNAFAIATLLVVVARERHGAPVGEGAANPYLLGLLAVTTLLTLVSGALYFAGNRETIRRVVR
jgi:CDP-diacylglycerol--glycerol-3-phosphate 3-phosphatidyltransferase